MKNIYFISELFPEKQGDLKYSIALYQLVKYWDSIYIIRPYYFFKFSPFIINFKRKPIYISRYQNTIILNVPVFKIPIIKKFIFINPRKISAILKNKPDIIVGHFLIGNRFAYHFSRRLNIPLTIGLHNSDISLILKGQKKYGKMLNNASRIICRSENIKNRLLMYMPQVKAKVYVANSGIDKKLIETKEYFTEKATNYLQKEEITFITVARLIPLKNIDFNLKVLAEFKNYNWTYTIVGDGPEKFKLEKLVQKLGLQDKVIFTGWLERDEILTKLQQSGVYLQVSAPETFGLVYLEAMAKGCVVIGTKGWGIDGIIKDNFNGFLVKPRDKEELLKVLAYVLSTTGKDRHNILVKEMFNTINRYTEKEQSTNYLKIIENIFEQ